MVNWHLNNIVHQSGQSGSAVLPGIDPGSLGVSPDKYSFSRYILGRVATSLT